MGKTLLLLLLLIGSAKAQITIDTPSDFITTDPMGNLYCIRNTEIVKYNTKGESQARYANARLGTIRSVDASDPLRILVFYEEFNRVLFLDKQLSEIGSSLDLYQYSPNEMLLVCSSRQGGFWLYDPEESQALKISAYGEVLTKSILISSLQPNFQPSQMQEQNGQLYLLFHDKGILTLTELGQYRQMLHIPGIESFQVHQNEIIYTKENRAYHFTPKASTDQALHPEANFQGQRFRMEANQLYYGNADRIHIKTINN